MIQVRRESVSRTRSDTTGTLGNKSRTASYSEQNTPTFERDSSNSNFDTIKAKLPNDLITTHYEDWSIHQVSKWLEFIKLEIFCESFVENEIDGSHLKELDREMLGDLGFKKLGNKLTFEREFKKVMKMHD